MMDEETRKRLADTEYIEKNIHNLSDKELSYSKLIPWNPDGEVGRLLQYKLDKRRGKMGYASFLVAVWVDRCCWCSRIPVNRLQALVWQFMIGTVALG
ncbi:MAG: hypothetical protein OES46_20060 [Gammaproteobacteria bacterium]|jgi:hypothetical protein|nr:hypothetical protein [Gammaproteobacteria bacterium]